MKTLTVFVVLMCSMITLVNAQTVPATTAPMQAVLAANKHCMLYVDNWADKCGNFGPIQLTRAQQDSKMSRCSVVSDTVLAGLPDNDPTATDKTVDALNACITGPDTAEDLNPSK